MTVPTIDAPRVSEAFQTFMRSVDEITLVPISFPALADLRRQVDVETRRPYRDFTAKIEAGVATLDAKLGRGTWLPRVNLSALDLAVESLCVAAQATHVSYFEAIGVLGGSVDDYEWGDARGFTVADVSCDQHGEVVMYARLTQQWRAKITELRAEGESVRITAPELAEVGA